jgi:hypothetical protein
VVGHHPPATAGVREGLHPRAIGPGGAVPGGARPRCGWLAGHDHDLPRPHRRRPRGSSSPATAPAPAPPSGSSGSTTAAPSCSPRSGPGPGCSRCTARATPTGWKDTSARRSTAARPAPRAPARRWPAPLNDPPCAGWPRRRDSDAVARFPGHPR